MKAHDSFALLLCLLVIGSLTACSGGWGGSPAASASRTNSPAPAAGASQTRPPSREGAGEALGSNDALELAAEYQQKCSTEENPSRACEILRSLLVVEVSMALQETERSRDRRGIDEALVALEFADEPELVISACRILGMSPDTPGIAAKLLSYLLESPYLEVQRVAAQVLSRNPEPGVAEVGRLWIGNHSGLPAGSDYEEYPDFPAHYAGMGFPRYPGAEWFSPLDSDRSIGWSTSDDPAAVSRWFSASLHAEALGAEQWSQRVGEQAAAAFKNFDESKLQRVQQLMEKAMKTQDPAAMAEIEKLQKELDSQSQEAGAAAEKGVDRVAIPSAASAQDARWIVAQEKGGRISRVVLVYRLPSLQRTVIQEVWNLGDYPSAWPSPLKNPG